MKIVVLYSTFIFLMMPHAANAQSSALRETKDCPIAKPFESTPAFQSISDTQSILYPMDGYKISRIQIFSPQKADLEIVWTPVEAFWGKKSAKVSINANSIQCFLADSFPVHTPAKQIEVRAQQKMEGLKVLFSDIPWDHEGECTAKELCPVFLKAMNQCKAQPDEIACGDFIENLHNLTKRNQCRRGFDVDPVPAIWLCDAVTNQNNILGDAMHLLKGLKFKKAVDYYKSFEFRDILDGAYAEEYDGL